MGSCGICLLKKPLYVMVLLSWKLLNICLLMGNSKKKPYFALLACTAFALPSILSLSQPTSFSNFYLSDSHPSALLLSNKWLCGAQQPNGVTAQCIQRKHQSPRKLGIRPARSITFIFCKASLQVGIQQAES